MIGFLPPDSFSACSASWTAWVPFRVSVFGFRCQRLLPLLDRFPYSSLLNKHGAENIACLRVVGLDFQQFVIMKHRFGDLALLQNAHLAYL